MTFIKSAWAIDGATSTSALARTEAYAANAGSEGVVRATDLKVTQLGVAGDGVQISAGAAIVLNRYQGSTINQAYTVVNPTVHTIGAGEIPGANATYIVAVTIGDPEFSQSGHPWMTGGMPTPGTEPTFAYVRPFVMLKTAFDARNFPAIALAQIVKTTTNITTAMITDLRELARPRQKIEMLNVAATAGNLAGSGAWQAWPPSASVTVAIPSWAKKAKVMSNLNGVKLLKAGTGNIRMSILGAGATSVTPFNEAAPAGGLDRVGYSTAGTIDVSAVAGSSVSIRAEGQSTNAGTDNTLQADIYTSFQALVIFEEAAI